MADGAPLRIGEVVAEALAVGELYARRRHVALGLLRLRVQREARGDHHYHDDEERA